MSEAFHDGCRVCARTDVEVVKRLNVLRLHTQKGSLETGRERICTGGGHPPKGVLSQYAKNVVEVLRREFGDLQDPSLAEFVGEMVQQHLVKPKHSFEVILDMPLANWRLVWNGSSLCEIALVCRKLYRSEADLERAQQITDLIGNLQGRKQPL